MPHNKCRINVIRYNDQDRSVIRILGEMITGNCAEATYLIDTLKTTEDLLSYRHKYDLWENAEYYDFIYSDKEVVRKLYTRYNYIWAEYSNERGDNSMPREKIETSYNFKDYHLHVYTRGSSKPFIYTLYDELSSAKHRSEQYYSRLNGRGYILYDDDYNAVIKRGDT